MSKADTDGGAPRESVRIVGDLPHRTGRPGGEVAAIELRSGTLAIEVLTLGASLTAAVHDPAGAAIPLEAGLPNWSDYDDPLANHFVGSTMGRWCRFVKDPIVWIDGTRHWLATSPAGVHAHGGPDGFSFQNWSPTIEHRAPGTTSVVLRHQSPEGHQGYPGHVSAEVEYRLAADGGLFVGYVATTTAPTLLGLANHIYWRIGDERIDDHELVLPAGRRLDIVDDLPSAESPVPVSGPDDFRSAQRLEDRRIDAFYIAETVDAVWRLAAPRLGLALELTSTELGAGVYTGDRDPVLRRGICCQFGPWPGSERRLDFPSPIVRPGAPYRASWRLRVRDC